jgi:N-acetyl-beta-hexosaminidase
MMRIEIKSTINQLVRGGLIKNKSLECQSTNSLTDKGSYGFFKPRRIKEIVKYAQSKNVEVIPEIEMPAHVSSAIAAYPELSCFGVYWSLRRSLAHYRYLLRQRKYLQF